MTARDGWTPGVVRIAMSAPELPGVLDHEEEVAGETWASFGLNRDGGRWCWIVTHLPTGKALASFERKGDAKRFCRLVSKVTDWQAVTGTERLTGDVRDAVRDAMDRCHAVHLVRIL